MVSVSKTTFSVSMDESLVEWLDSEYNNRSAAIRKLVKAARNGGGAAEDAVRQYHIQQLEADLTRQELQVEATQERLETLKSIEEESKSTDEAKLEEARETLENVPKVPDNPAIQHWADKLDTTPEDLIDEL